MVSPYWVSFQNTPIALWLKYMLLQDDNSNVDLLSSYLRQNTLPAFIQSNFYLPNYEDHLIWKPGSKGEFIIKLAWNSI